MGRRDSAKRRFWGVWLTLWHHFGWGHPYSSHWSGDKNLPTVPVSGPMFPGSGTGIVYYDHEHFPPAYRQVFILNDWLDVCAYLLTLRHRTSP